MLSRILSAVVVVVALMSVVFLHEVEGGYKTKSYSKTVTKSYGPAVVSSQFYSASPVSSLAGGHWIWVADAPMSSSVRTQVSGPAYYSASPVRVQQKVRSQSYVRSGCPNGGCPPVSSRSYRKSKSYSYSRSQ